MISVRRDCQGGSIQWCYMEANIIKDRPHIKVGLIGIIMKRKKKHKRSMLMIINTVIAVFHNYFNPFRLSFSEPKCARGGHILFLESLFQHSP